MGAASALQPDSPLAAWLLDSDPALRWQALRDLLDAPAAQVAAERARVAEQGLGAQLLALQGADGTWGGAAWGRGWTSTMHALMLLRDLGLDPAGAPARRALARVREHVTWRGCGPPECDANRFFDGELEPCINGQVGAAGAYFGQPVEPIIARLLSEQLPDGGWNCEAERGSTRASFHTTICVLEALLAYEQAGGPRADEARAARARGQEYMLERRMYRRRSTGDPIADRKARGGDWTELAFPTWWRYDILRGLDLLRRAGAPPDERAAEAVALVEARRGADGRWALDALYPGAALVDLGEREGQPSRWVTLRALRVLRWHRGRGAL